MRALKIMVAWCMVAGFTVNYANAQQKEVYTSDYYWMYFDECIGENIEGTLLFTETYWINKEQNQLRWKGYMIGEISGNVYEVSSVHNYHSNLNKGDVYTTILNFVVTYQGMTVAHHKVTFHYTINANGEMTAWVNNDFYLECD
jgi:hypothetical protein